VRRRLVCVLLLLFTVLDMSAPRAQDSLDIVAVVNDAAITKVDLLVRLQLVMRSSGLQDTPETRARLAPQVLRALIDERLKRQAVESAGISASREEVVRALTRFAAANGMTIDQFNAAVEQDPLVAEAFTDEAVANIGWQKLIGQKLGPTVNVTEQDVDEEMRRIQDSRGKPEYQVAEIFLGVDQPQQDAAAKESADRLMEQLRAGADFSKLARDFSQSTTAANGGLVGWVRPDQVDDELASALAGMKPGQVSGPVRAAGGYYLVELQQIRAAGTVSPDEAVVSLKQVFITAPANQSKAERDAAMQKILALRASLKSCADMDSVGGTFMPAGSVDLGTATVANLPAPLRDLGRTLPVGQVSQPIQVDTGVGVFMICDRTLPADTMPTRDQVARNLLSSRLDQLARGYLRDLRRAAVIDIRNAAL
jgi:peptidyl-prolyl cis-trans isomerase SurA